MVREEGEGGVRGRNGAGEAGCVAGEHKGSKAGHSGLLRLWKF